MNSKVIRKRHAKHACTHFTKVCTLLLCTIAHVFSTDDGTCEICPPNSYCHGKFMFNCPGNQISNAGSQFNTDCKCRPGHHGKNGESCSICPADSFCLGGEYTSACRQNYKSDIGSNSSINCICPESWYLSSSGDCDNSCALGMNGNGYSTNCTHTTTTMGTTTEHSTPYPFTSMEVSIGITSDFSTTPTSNTSLMETITTTPSGFTFESTSFDEQTTTPVTINTTVDIDDISNPISETSTPISEPPTPISETSNTTSDISLMTTTVNYTSTPIPQITNVTFEATLLMTRAAFNQEAQDMYKRGVAIALSVSPSDISIVSVVEKAGNRVRRRLLDIKIVVETTATVSTDIAQSVVSSVTDENLKNQLTDSGIVVGEISQPVLRTVKSETNPVTNLLITCAAGTYSSFDKTTCVTCPSGTYSTTINAESFPTCILCDVSTYSHVVGASSATTCIACEKGKFTPKKGATWVGQCTRRISRHIC